MTEPTPTAELLKGDLASHTPMMAQYQGVAFQAAWSLGFCLDDVPPVPV